MMSSGFAAATIGSCSSRGVVCSKASSKTTMLGTVEGGGVSIETLERWARHGSVSKEVGPGFDSISPQSRRDGASTRSAIAVELRNGVAKIERVELGVFGERELYPIIV